MRNSNLILLFTFAYIFSLSLCLISYANQSNWPGICTTGHNNEQSPINILTSGDEYHGEYDEIQVYSTNYRPLKNVERVIEETEYYYHFRFEWDEVVDNFLELKYNDELYRFQLNDVHFHCPSEHKINGNSYACEFHLVHQRSHDGNDEDQFELRNTLVVSLLVEGTDVAENAILTDRDMDFSPYINKNVDFYYYIGSKTSPPCNEAAFWLISTQTLSISRSQLESLVSLVSEKYTSTTTGNARNIQELNDRKIYLIKALSTSYLAFSMLITFLFFFLF